LLQLHLAIVLFGIDIEKMSYQSIDNGNKSRRGWVDKNNHYERYYCETCNVWLASDKASVLTHRNGKKHLDNTKFAQSKKLNASAAQEKQQAAMQASLKQMEMAAKASYQQDYCLFAESTMGLAPLTAASINSVPNENILNSNHPAPQISSSSDIFKEPVVKHERKEWDDRKKQRDAEKQKHRVNQDASNEDNESGSNHKRRKITINENDGYYSTGENTVWLNGAIYGEILEEDMPIQIWLGNAAATETELKLPENQRHWKDGLIVALRTSTQQSNDMFEDRMVVDVAYLDKPNDSDELMKKSVRLRHVRILLGNEADDRIPTTLDEARVLAMGGEVVKPSNIESASLEIDESTGLSGWSTVHINRTTIRNEMKAERDLIRKERKEAVTKAEKAAKDAERRRMEEAKVSNADDSALGAYDIWGRTKDGYKGVQIHVNESSVNTAKISVHDYGKKLAMDGVNTGFKNKSTGTLKKKRQNRRTTSADDD
jgi:hypothetical protein